MLVCCWKRHMLSVEWGQFNDPSVCGYMGLHCSRGPEKGG
jgi:hypothetical protein